MAVFCTDAGHGKPDTGAVWQGVMEKDLNWQMVRRLNSYLKERDHQVWTTRRNDVHVPPLKTRCQLINRHHQLKRPAFDAIVSVHCNVAARWDETRQTYIPLPQHKGLYVIYSAESSEATALARHIAKACANAGLPLARDGLLSTVELGRSLAWIHQTLPTAVLIETGFLTNPQDLKNLQDADYQQQLVEAITAGLEAFVQPVA